MSRDQINGLLISHFRIIANERFSAPSQNKSGKRMDKEDAVLVLASLGSYRSI